MSAVVDGLFAVLATMGVVPIIRCPKVSHGNPHQRHVGAAAEPRRRLTGSECSAVLFISLARLHTAFDRRGPMPDGGLLQGGAAEAVAAQLEGRLRAALKSRANPFSEAAPALAGQLGRPLLALFDRSFELRCAGFTRFRVGRNLRFKSSVRCLIESLRDICRAVGWLSVGWLHLGHGTAWCDVVWHFDVCCMFPGAAWRCSTRGRTRPWWRMCWVCR